MNSALYVIATPIGNIEDLSPRARATLGSVDFILAEDTRRTGLLLKELGIKRELLSYYDHNERERTPQIVEMLKQGKSAALVSDGGTPTISDPGYRIINACYEAKIKVSPVPGPAALIAALSVSGLPTDRFIFEGFLPPKGNKRIDRIKRILASDCTSVVYESTHKIERLINEIERLDPERELVIARELTKTFEEILRGSARDLLEIVKRPGGLKGEIVVLIRAAQQKPKKKKFQRDEEE